MNKSAIFKIAGIVIASFLVITVITFFLYPYLNKDKYEQIQNERQINQPSGEFEGNSLSSGQIEDKAYNGQLAGDHSFYQDSTGTESTYFAATIDSLQHLNDSLTVRLEEVLANLTELEEAVKKNGADPAKLVQANPGGNDAAFIQASEEPKEEFSERVKSLLNLDEDELKPIANQMSQQELVRIYSNSGNIQREKLLRSLSPERAAKLMKEIML